MNKKNNQKHGFHLVDSSPWPLISALMLTFGAVLFMHGYFNEKFLVKFYFIFIIFSIFCLYKIDFNLVFLKRFLMKCKTSIPESLSFLIPLCIDIDPEEGLLLLAVLTPIFFVAFIRGALFFFGEKFKVFFKGIQTTLEIKKKNVFFFLCVVSFSSVWGLFSLTEAVIGGVFFLYGTKMLIILENKNKKIFEILLGFIFIIRILFERVNFEYLGFLLFFLFLWEVASQFKSFKPVNLFVKDLKESQEILKVHKEEAFFYWPSVERFSTLVLIQLLVFPVNPLTLDPGFIALIKIYCWSILNISFLLNIIVVNLFNAPTKATQAAITTCASCVGMACGVTSVYFHCVDQATNPARDPGTILPVRLIQEQRFDGCTAPTRASLQACLAFKEVYRAKPPTYHGTNVVDHDEVQRIFNNEKDALLKQRISAANRRARGF